MKMKKIRKQKNDTFLRSRGARFQGNELKYLSEILSSDLKFATVRSWISRFESAFAKRFGAKYAIASNSGTAALHQALAAVGIGPGDEVIIPAMTVIMCGYAVIQMHAVPIYADVDPRTFLIDPLDIERKITSRTKAIMVVHFCGQVCDMPAIMKLAKKHNLYIIEDCAQCFLGKDVRGRLAGTIGHIGCFSLESTKTITTGEGGVLITNNQKLATRIRKFGALGFKRLTATGAMEMPNALMFQDPKFLRHDAFGYNYRMAQPLAAIALAQLERINIFSKKRIQMARKYTQALDGCSWLVPQYVPKGSIHVYWTFAFLFEGKEKLGISWYDFRDKFIKFGGDKIRSTFALVYNEPTMINLNRDGRYFVDSDEKQGRHHQGYLKKTDCPVAEKIQPKLMQLTTNQLTSEDMDHQADALRRTIKYFENHVQKT